MRIAMAQLDIVDGNIAENIRRAESAVREGAAKGADFICLPEAADFGWLYQHSQKDAHPVPGNYTNFLSDLASELKTWVSAGCLERDQENAYNSAVIIDRTGRIVLKHRKINTLPDLTAHLYNPGRCEDTDVVDTEFGRIGLTICADNFDLSIPQKAADMGAWLLIAPHGFAAEEDDLPNNAQTYRNHISKVASGTGLWIIAADAALSRVAGGKWKGRLHSGCSIVADPSGNIIAEGKFAEPDLVICDIPEKGVR